MGKEGTPECPRLEWGVSYEVRMGERVRLKARAAFFFFYRGDEWNTEDGPGTEGHPFGKLAHTE